MSINFNEWQEVYKYNLPKVIDMVITNGTIESLSDDYWLISYMENKSDSGSVLDFGCGIGRNIFKFCQNKPNWNFTGYDNDNMFEKSKLKSFIIKNIKENLMQ
jgi:SAM-dependent methyltransferase